MSTKKVIASYAVELTDDGSDFPSITVTRQGSFADYFALPATGTSLGIYATMLMLCGELQRTWSSRRLLELSESASHPT